MGHFKLSRSGGMLAAISRPSESEPLLHRHPCGVPFLPRRPASAAAGAAADAQASRQAPPLRSMRAVTRLCPRASPGTGLPRPCPALPALSTARLQQDFALSRHAPWPSPSRLRAGRESPLGLLPGLRRGLGWGHVREGGAGTSSTVSRQPKQLPQRKPWRIVLCSVNTPVHFSLPDRHAPNPLSVSFPAVAWYAL
jgi:hypothetical protein